MRAFVKTGAMIRSYLKKIFLPVPREQGEIFREAISSDNLTRLILGGAVLSAVELGVFATSMNMGLDINSYPLAAIVFTLIMISLVMVLRRNPGRKRVKQAVVYSAVTFYLAWSCLFTWSTRTMASMSMTILPLSVYMLMVYGIAVFIFLEPVGSAVFFFVSFSLFVLMLPFGMLNQREVAVNIWNAVALNVFAWITSRLIFGFRLRSFLDNTMIQRKNSELETEKKNLEEALAKVRHLSGLLPICASCKKVRDDGGYWQQVEEYVAERSEATFSHSFCPECMKKLYPDLDKDAPDRP